MGSRLIAWVVGALAENACFRKHGDHSAEKIADVDKIAPERKTMRLFVSLIAVLGAALIAGSNFIIASLLTPVPTGISGRWRNMFHKGASFPRLSFKAAAQ